MNLGSNLYSARKKSGLSQEEVAEKLGVSRQTISKWETDETLPDIRQAKRLAGLYRLTLDDLIAFDAEVEEIERAIDSISEETQKKVDWTKVWGKRYPVLTTYRQQVKISDYAVPLRELLDRLKREYGYSDVDACLVLKDILAHVWNAGGPARTEIKRWGRRPCRFPQKFFSPGPPRAGPDRAGQSARRRRSAGRWAGAGPACG